MLKKKHNSNHNFVNLIFFFFDILFFFLVLHINSKFKVENFKYSFSKKIKFLKTNQFNINENDILGSGGFGTVYKGTLNLKNK